MTTKLTLFKGASYTHQESGKVFLKGVPTPVSPALAEVLKDTGRFIDAGAPIPQSAAAVKKAKYNPRKIVRLKDSIADDEVEKAAKLKKKERQAAEQKEFEGYVAEAKKALPEFKTIKDVYTFAKEEGITLFKAKLPEAIDELVYHLADEEFKAQRVQEEEPTKHEGSEWSNPKNSTPTRPQTSKAAKDLSPKKRVKV